MKFRYKILLGFSLFILLSLAMLIINLSFYSRTAARMDIISSEIFAINLYIQDCSLILYKVQADVWNTFLPEIKKLSRTTEDLDIYANQFYSNIRNIWDITEEDEKYQVLMDSFKNYYLFATSLKQELDEKGLNISEDVLRKFEINRDYLNAHLHRITTETRNSFEAEIKDLQNDLNAAVIGIIIAGMTTLMLSIGISILMAKKLTQPIEDLTGAAYRITQGDYDIHISSNSSKEIHLLSESFNIMADHIKNTLHDLNVTKEELELSHNFLDSVIHSLSSLLITIDRDFKIRLINQAALDYFHLDSGRVLETDVWKTLPSLRSFEKEIMHAAKMQVIWHDIGTVLQDDQSTYFDITLYPMMHTSTEGLVIVLKDVSENIKKDEQIRQMQKMETIGILSAGLAHDFNNILTVIMNANILIQTYLGDSNDANEGIYEMITAIEAATKKAADLVKNLLSLSRKQEINFSHCDLNDVLRDISKMSLRTFDKSVKIETVEYPGEAVTMGDSNQLGQAILNLSINAWHAMTIMRPEGEKRGGTLYLSLSKENKFHNELKSFWVFTVRDTGIGINEETREKIFDPFFTTKATGQGTGLGLAMVYNIIQLHHGFIEVDSEINKGTEFRIYIPADEVEDPTTDHLELKNTFGPGTVLLIDDETLIRKTTSDILHNLGFNVLTAPNGEQGLEVFKKVSHKTDFIILDLSMPVISGYETFYQLREINPDIPVLIHSGFKDENQVNQLLENQAVAFLQKPYTINDLKEIIHLFLKK